MSFHFVDNVKEVFDIALDKNKIPNEKVWKFIDKDRNSSNANENFAK